MIHNCNNNRELLARFSRTLMPIEPPCGASSYSGFNATNHLPFRKRVSLPLSRLLRQTAQPGEYEECQ